jgi:GT2 family glycosyltransferase
MARISYAITVCNELEEIKRLIPFLIKHKQIHDEIVILFDEKNGTQEVLDYLRQFNLLPNVQTWRNFFTENFAEAKNRLNMYCKNEWIYQLDADEMIDENLMLNLPDILESNQNIDLFFVPRINIVNGITEEHIQKWKWHVNENGWINFPDFQGRIYRNKAGIEWSGKVHERIIGAKNYTSLPTEEVYCIKHIKEISRQERQNNLYLSIQ